MWGLELLRPREVLGLKRSDISESFPFLLLFILQGRTPSLGSGTDCLWLIFRLDVPNTTRLGLIML